MLLWMQDAGFKVTSVGKTQTAPTLKITSEGREKVATATQVTQPPSFMEKHVAVTPQAPLMMSGNKTLWLIVSGRGEAYSSSGDCLLSGQSG
jgi:hypothetical protein